MDRLTYRDENAKACLHYGLDGLWKKLLRNARYHIITGAIERLTFYEDAEEQRNKGCEWCNKKRNTWHIKLSDGYQVEPKVIDTLEPNFCPMCGRKLKESE